MDGGPEGCGSVAETTSRYESGVGFAGSPVAGGACSTDESGCAQYGTEVLSVVMLKMARNARIVYNVANSGRPHPAYVSQKQPAASWVGAGTIKLDFLAPRFIIQRVGVLMPIARPSEYAISEN